MQELSDDVFNRVLVEQKGARSDVIEVVWFDDEKTPWVSIRSTEPALVPMVAAARQDLDIPGLSVMTEPKATGVIGRYIVNLDEVDLVRSLGYR